MQGGRAMETQRALQIAKREWENIRLSLQDCGDIGEFLDAGLLTELSRGLDLDAANFSFPKSPIHMSKSTKSSLLAKELIDMDYKLIRLPTYGYFTPEAAHVFTALTSRAVKRLGLKERTAKTFGSGYSLVRTGCLDSNGAEKQRWEQMEFLKFFFPVRGGFNWDFNSLLVKKKLKLIFDKFLASQPAREKKNASETSKTESTDFNIQA
jgi:hypothetical protein